MATLSADDRRRLPDLLADLSKAVEEVLFAGLTTASESTRKTLGVSFREASRMRLLRLGGTLRVAIEQLGKYTGNAADFSPRRLSFFLNRAWMLSEGMARALQSGDDALLERLMWTPASRPARKLQVVVLGVAKRVVPGAFCSFEFRMRSLRKAGDLPGGSPLVWSAVFPLKDKAGVPAEAYLHLPQKQGFTAAELLESRPLAISEAMLSGADDGGAARVSLTDKSKVEAGDEPFEDWGRFLAWDREAALARVQGHTPGPFDLDVELQEEVVLEDWRLGEPIARGDGLAYPIDADGLALVAPLPEGKPGAPLRDRMKEMRKQAEPGGGGGSPKLYGLMHYEMCELVFQPLAVFRAGEPPEYLALSNESVDRAALLKTMKF